MSITIISEIRFVFSNTSIAIAQPKMTQLVPGTFLKNNEYLIQSYLGEGMFARTYKAIRYSPNNHESIVAIKIAKSKEELPDYSRKKLDLDFTDESQKMSNFNHKYIVGFIDKFYDTDIDSPCLAMEFIKGKTLQDLRWESNKISHQKAVKYTIQIAEALKKIHSQGWVHLDVKPNNIVRKNKYEVMLIDFGLAREFNPEITKDFNSIAPKKIKNIQNKTKICKFFPPLEQRCLLDKFAPGLDIYSLSATFYFLLTGRRPVSSRDREHALNNRRLDPLQKNCEDSIENPNFRNVILTGMQLKREERPQSMSKWLKLLKDS